MFDEEKEILLLESPKERGLGLGVGEGGGESFSTYSLEIINKSSIVGQTQELFL